MHICFLDGHYPNLDGTGGGGAGWYIKMIGAHHIKKGNDVTVLKVTPDHHKNNYIDSNGVQIIHYKTSSLFLDYFSKIPLLKVLTRSLVYLLHSWIGYKYIVKQNAINKIDILEVVDGGNFWLSLFNKFNYVEHLHCSQYTIKKQCGLKVQIEHNLERRLSFFSLSRAAAIISPSNAMLSIVEKERNVLFPRKIMIPLCVEKNIHTVIKRNKKVRFIFASRNDPLKGRDTLFRAIKIVNKKIYDKVEFNIIGYSPNSKSILPENVIIKDFISRYKILEEYPNCDVALLPSLFDNSPLFIYETMAAGLPVIATNVGGIPELVEHGKTGFLFKTNDHVTLSRFIIELVENPKKRMAMGVNAQKFIHQYASVDKIAKQKLKLYKSVIG